MERTDPSVFLKAFANYAGDCVIAGGWIADLQGELMTGEAAFVANAVEKRKREFVAGRTAARQALARLGSLPLPILAGEHRAPLWPTGYTGSITHCDELAFAAVVEAHRGASIGIDVERHERMRSDLWSAVFSKEEEAGFLSSEAPDLAAAAAFSAKESFEKAQFAATGRVMEMGVMETHISADGTFTIRHHAGADFSPVPEHVQGIWSLTGSHVFTAVGVSVAWQR